MSFKPEVQVGTDPKWYDNALRFATCEEALANARDLMGRWTLVTAYRHADSTDPVNYRWTENGLEAVPTMHDCLAMTIPGYLKEDS